jgi:hypothetical protein
MAEAAAHAARDQRNDEKHLRWPSALVLATEDQFPGLGSERNCGPVHGSPHAAVPKISTAGPAMRGSTCVLKQNDQFDQ